MVRFSPFGSVSSSSLIFGFPLLESIYLAIALTLSSTVIAVKMIYDKSDNNALYGQVTIGILLVQDLIAILAPVAAILIFWNITRAGLQFRNEIDANAKKPHSVLENISF